MQFSCDMCVCLHVWVSLCILYLSVYSLGHSLNLFELWVDFLHQLAKFLLVIISKYFFFPIVLFCPFETPTTYIVDCLIFSLISWIFLYFFFPFYIFISGCIFSLQWSFPLLYQVLSSFNEFFTSAVWCVCIIYSISTCSLCSSHISTKIPISVFFLPFPQNSFSFLLQSF